MEEECDINSTLWHWSIRIEVGFIECWVMHSFRLFDEKFLKYSTIKLQLSFEFCITQRAQWFDLISWYVSLACREKKTKSFSRIIRTELHSNLEIELFNNCCTDKIRTKQSNIVSTITFLWKRLLLEFSRINTTPLDYYIDGREWSPL